MKPSPNRGWVFLSGRSNNENIPVKGIVVHSAGRDSEHSHKLYITSWNGRPVHVHPFSGTTSYDVGHAHRNAGITAPAASGVQHTHGYYTETTFDDGHIHLIRGVTGPAVSLQGGGHIHYFEGTTTVNGRIPHVHQYGGKTGNQLGD